MLNNLSIAFIALTPISSPVKPTSFSSTALFITNADTSGSLQPNQGDPANKIYSFRWGGNEQGYIDTDAKITFAGFKTPAGTSSQFLKANGTVDSNTYVTSTALNGYATQAWVNLNYYNRDQIDDFFSGAENVGLDPKKTKHVPVDTVENCRNQIFALLDGIEKNPSLKGKFIISIDSLGNLSAQKELNDAEAGKSAGDMGLRAKQLKSMLRTLTYKAARTGTTILFSNHTYDDPAAMYPTLVKKQSGGSGPIYMASLLVQLASRSEKQDDKNENDKMLPEAKNYSGVTLRALTVKNRFVPPYLEAEMYLNFLTGLDKYAGILGLAVNHGVIIQTGSTYTLPDGTKLGYYSKFKEDKNFWDNKIIPEVEKIIKEKYKYGNSSSDASIEIDDEFPDEEGGVEDGQD